MNDQSLPSELVRTLQLMLREISFHSPGIPRPLPDGVYGDHTLEAVAAFQRQFHPPVNGRVDAGTWEALVRQYRLALEAPTPPPAGGPPAGLDFGSLTENFRPHADLVQAMYRALSRQLENLRDCPADGACGPVFRQNARVVQEATGLPATGELDQNTWNALSTLYTIFVTYAQTPWQTRQQALSGPRDAISTQGTPNFTPKVSMW